MTSINALHISHSVRHGDGGIAFAVGDLLSTQQSLGIYSRWLTADQFTPMRRDLSLLDKIKSISPNIAHYHGLWRSHTRIINHIEQLQGYSVVAPHGMLDAWAMAHASWKKELVWSLWESQALRKAGCIHALCYPEAVAIQKRLPKTPIALIPNGVHIPSNRITSRNELPWVNNIHADDKILLFFGRFHLKKGIEPLLTAWQAVVDLAQDQNWHLVLVGFGDDGKLRSQLRSFPIPHCHVYSPVFGLQKTAVLQHSNAFILPSYSEGLPVAALEAMAHRLPCLLSTACNLPEAFRVRAALVAEPESAQLIPCLKQLFRLTSDELLMMGSSGFHLVENKFGWKKSSDLTQEVYEWLLGLSNQPDCVRTNWGD